MSNEQPILEASWFSRHLTWDGASVELRIYRRVEEKSWTLEVINSKGVSRVWDDRFPSDVAAEEEFQRMVSEAGMSSFYDDDTVIEFPSNE